MDANAAFAQAQLDQDYRDGRESLGPLLEHFTASYHALDRDLSRLFLRSWRACQDLPPEKHAPLIALLIAELIRIREGHDDELRRYEVGQEAAEAGTGRQPVPTQQPLQGATRRADHSDATFHAQRSPLSTQHPSTFTTGRGVPMTDYIIAAEPGDLSVMLYEAFLAEQGDDYDRRSIHLYVALAMAKELKYLCGIRIDGRVNMAGFRPTLVIELPDQGEVSWHMEEYSQDWDQSGTAQKWERVRAFCNVNPPDWRKSGDPWIW